VRQDGGKSKRQFYAPSDVSRIMVKVIGIYPATSIAATTAYDSPAVPAHY
jgi:type I restriction enzyme M protein